VRAVAILDTCFGQQLKELHAARRAALFAVVAAVFIARKVQLTALGRALGGIHKHSIKKVDRLLGNRELHQEHLTIYAALARMVVGATPRPVILVDWTDLGRGHAAIVAAHPVKGRSIQLYAEVYPRKQENQPAAEKRFLKNLQTILPPGCRPVLVTDAGFRVPWLRQVVKLGWDYVARVRGRSKSSFDGGRSWVPLRELFSSARSRAKSLGSALLTQHSSFGTNLVTFAGRPYASTRRKKLPAGSHARRKAIRSAREPWVLATSLTDSAHAVVKAYRQRMQIEEAFRDKKSTTLGWSLGETKTRSRERLGTLMLIAGLAHFLAIEVGRIAEELRLHLNYQASSEKARRVVSLPRLGALILGNNAGKPPSELTTHLAARFKSA